MFMKLFKKFETFINYLLSAGVCFAVDLALFSLFSLILKNYVGDFAIFLATILARIISSLINYFLNRNAVFKVNNKVMDIKTLTKYYFLVVIQMLLSATIVSSLYKTFNIYETLIKIPVEIVLFFINYIIQKLFIFPKEEKNFKIAPKYYKVIAFILSIITTFSLLFQIKSKTLSFSRNNTMIITYIVLTFLLFNFYKKYLFKFKNKISYIIIAITFSLLLIFGYSYDIIGNANLVIGNIPLILFSILKFIGLFNLLNTSILLFDNFIKEKEIPAYQLPFKKLLVLFDKHPFLFSFIFILICYLPYIIAYYPVIINYDAANQVKEVMGIHTRYMDSVILLNPNMTITNFNPIIHTFLIGGLFKVGYLLGNVNFGMFLYSIVQLLIVISTFAYTIYYLKKCKVNKILILITLLTYAIVPLFPFYAMTSVKDVIFSSLILLYVIKLYDIMKNPQTLKQYIFFTFLILLIILFRNNGIYTIILTLPVLIFTNKKISLNIIIILLINILMYISYNNILLPHFEIANTSVREMLSVPFQQTARLAKYHDKAIAEEDKKIIDKVLGYSDLASRYDPKLSDDVKNKYNKYTTAKELKDYFGVWFKYLLKYPVTYIDATINNTYGYFYPNTSSGYVYTSYNHKLKDAGFDYHFNNLTGLRQVLIGYAEAFPYIPIIGTIANIGLVTWCYIFLLGSLITNNLKKYIILLGPSITLILVCVLGPANTYFRYILPCVFALPFIINILYYELKKLLFTAE